MTHLPQNKPAREIELKFAVPADSLDAIALLLASKAPADGQVSAHHQVTTYFDTQQETLSRNGMSLRVRRTNDHRIQTLKAGRKGGVAADRAEWEWPVDHDEPDLSLLKQTPAAKDLPRDADLKPVLITDIDRKIHMLTLDGDTVVEAALDQGFIAAGEARQPVRELELELRKGQSAPLFRLALELLAAAPLTIESDSKAARGYRLRSGLRPTAQKADDVDLDHGISAAEAFQQIIGAELGHLLANQPAALAGDPEGVHQMRVSIRRLRAALTLFQPHLEPEEAARFQTELQRVGRIMGDARDWDVFCLQILPDLQDTDTITRWTNLLRPPATARQQEAHQRLVQELQAPAFTTLVLGLANWTEQGNVFAEASLRQPLAKLCPALLDRMARKVDRRGRHIRHRSDHELHALRKALKRLRYSLDFLQPVLPHRAAKSYLDNCKKLQESLGGINDVVAASALARDLGGGSDTDLEPAVLGLTQHLQQRRNDAFHDLVPEWKNFRATQPFWEQAGVQTH